jgi:hypothetical protein
MSKHSLYWINVLLIGSVLMAASGSGLEAQTKKAKKSPATSSDTTDPNATDPNETKNKPPIESDDLPADTYVGTMVTVPNEGGLFRVAVEYKRIRAKAGKEAQVEKLQKDIVKKVGDAYASQAFAAATYNLRPRGYFGYYGYYGYHYYDHYAAARAVGNAKGNMTKAQGDIELLKGMLENVSDSQTVIFHSDPKKVQVRLLTPAQSADSASTSTSESTPNPSLSKGKAEDAKEKDAKEKDAREKQDKNLPGYEGTLADLKEGQRVRLTLIAMSKASVYKRMVKLIVVEEESSLAPPPSSSSLSE